MTKINYCYYPRRNLNKPFFTFKMKQASKMLNIITFIMYSKQAKTHHKIIHFLSLTKNCIQYNIALFITLHCIIMSEFPFSLKFFYGHHVMHSKKILLPLNVQEAMQNARKYNARAKKKLHTLNAQKGNENEIALTYFPILPSGSILMHFFMGRSYFLFSLLIFFFAFFGVIVNFLSVRLLPFRFHFHFRCNMVECVSLTDKSVIITTVYVCQFLFFCFFCVPVSKMKYLHFVYCLT